MPKFLSIITIKMMLDKHDLDGRSCMLLMVSVRLHHAQTSCRLCLVILAFAIKLYVFSQSDTASEVDIARHELG